MKVRSAVPAMVPARGLISGACSPGAGYEGCLVSGYPSDATEDAVQANIVAAGYSK